MRDLLFSVILLSGTLAAQPAASSRIITTLQEMARGGASPVSLREQFVEEMLALAPADRRPSRGALEGFTTDFSAALAGRDLSNIQAAALQRAITDLLGGTGTNL